jgi:hypothetical protein
MSTNSVLNRNKIIVANDFNETKDHASLSRHRYGDTQIDIVNPETGELIWRGHNKIILPGAGFTARSHFDLPRNEITPSYNTALGLENTVIETPDSLEKVFLFCVGTDGCGRENSDVFDVNYAKWITPDALIPFRYVPRNEDLDITLREKYFGRVLVGNRVAYYFKAFENTPEFVQQYVDGTPISADIYESDKTEEVESYVDIRLAVTKEDCRDWFIQGSSINDARINTISLCTAWAKYFEISSGEQVVYYQDIRPLTKLNIPNEALIDLTKGMDIIYHIYY